LTENVTQYGIGIVGTGHGARVVAPAFSLDTRARICGFTAARLESAASAVTELGTGQAYAHWRDLIADPAIDIVAIAVPPAHVEDIAIAAVHAGKAIFLEKPLAAGITGARNISDAVNGADTPNVVDFIFPELPVWQTALKYLHGNTLGRIRHVGVHWTVMTYANKHLLDSWKIRPEDGGGAVFNFGAHTFHYLELMIGPIRRVFVRRDTASIDTRWLLEVTFDNDTTGEILLDDGSEDVRHEINITGDAGHMALVNYSTDYAHGFSGEISLSDGSTPLQFATPLPPSMDNTDGRIAATAGLASRLLDGIECGEPASPNCTDGLRVQILLDCTSRSNENHAWVDVPPGLHE
jgi:predicted dehydrogenase